MATIRPAPFTSGEAARLFTLAGNATVTLRSKTTDTRFTFKVTKSKNPERDPIWWVSLMNGPDNENSFVYFGMIKDGKFIHGGRKARAGADTPSVKAFAWSWLWLSERSAIPPTLEVWHEAKCGRCGRKLTVPESISSGFGPDCIELVGGRFLAEAV